MDKKKIYVQPMSYVYDFVEKSCILAASGTNLPIDDDEVVDDQQSKSSWFFDDTSE